jgi:hypothetical protein
MRLDGRIADRIVESVRQHLPDEVSLHRRRATLVVRSRWERFSHDTSSSAVFAHLSPRDDVQAAAKECLGAALDLVTGALTRAGHHWPDLDYGPVTVRTWLDAKGAACGEITDRNGTAIIFLPVMAAT